MQVREKKKKIQSAFAVCACPPRTLSYRYFSWGNLPVQRDTSISTEGGYVARSVWVCVWMCVREACGQEI